MNHRTIVLVAALALSPLAAGCSSTATPEKSGFLGDYSKLTPHPSLPGALRWVKPGIDLRDYDSLMFDPVEVRLAPDSAAGSLSPETLARAAAKFHEILVETIAPFYSVVEQPGAHTLRVRAALTDVRPGTSDADVGGAGVEAELLDAATGERLAASMTHAPAATTAVSDSDDVPERWRGVAGIFRERAHRLLDFLDSHSLGGE